MGQLYLNEEEYGGGTNVVANPSGTATATLQKLTVGTSIYDIPSGGASDLDDLSDVNITTPSSGQVIKYNSTSQKWENSAESGGTTVVPNPSGTATETLNTVQIGTSIYDIPSGGGGATDLDDLTDVDISSPTNGQILQYNSTSQKWVNAVGGGGTTVIPNPGGTPEEDLETIQIGTSVFSIPSGGSGGTLTLLAGSVDSILSIGQHILSDSLENYDSILVCVCYQNYTETGLPPAEYPIDAIKEQATDRSYAHYAYLGYCDFKYIDDNTIEILRYSGVSITAIYGIKYGGGSGAGLDEMTLSDYEALSTSQKNDGTARFILHDDGLVPVNMALTAYLQDSGVMAVAETSDTKTTVTYKGGMNIGCSFYYTTAVDVTNYDKIVMDIQTGDCYGGGAHPTQQSFNFYIGLMANAISSAFDPTSASWVTSINYDNSNYDYSGTELDVSSLTGTYYITVCSHGFSATIENIQLKASTIPSQIKYMSKTYALETFTGATSSVAGTSGGVPAPLAGDNDKYLRGDGTWNTPTGSGGSKTSLFHGATYGTNVTLSDSITNYDFIMLVTRNSTPHMQTSIYCVSTMVTGDILFCGDPNWGFVAYYYTDATHLNNYNSIGTNVLTDVIGIKL